MVNEMDKRTATLVTHLKEEEAELIRLKARDTYNMSVSDLIRKALSLVGCGRFNFRIETNDLTRLAQELTIFNLRVGFLLDCLMDGGEISPAEIEELRQQTNELYDYVRKCYNLTLAERKIQQKHIETYLQEQIDKILKLTKGF